MKPGYYTFFFCLTWVLLLRLALNIIPGGWYLIFIIIYSLISIALYFKLHSFLIIYFDRDEQKKHDTQHTIKENTKLFLKEQELKRKYKYIKLNNKDNIIKSDIISIEDKKLLLGIIHGCTREETDKLLGNIKS